MGDNTEALPPQVADAELKALYVAHFGSDAGWLGAQGSAFIEGARAALAQRRQVPTDPLREALQRIVDWDAAGMALTEDHIAQARAALAQRQHVPGLEEAFRAAWKQEVGSVSNTAGRDVAFRVMCAALTAAPSAQAEPVAWVSWINLISAELARKRGGPFDQHTWSEARTEYHETPLYAAPPAAQAEPQVPLTDEQIVMDGLMMTPTKTLESCADAFTAGVRFAERAHGIGKQEGQA